MTTTFKNVTFTNDTSMKYSLEDNDLGFGITVNRTLRGDWEVRTGGGHFDPLTAKTFAQLVDIAAQFASAQATN